MSRILDDGSARLALAIAAQGLRDKAKARFRTHGVEDARGAAIWDSAYYIDPFGENAVNIPPPDDDMSAEEFDARLDAATPVNVTAGSRTVIVRHPETPAPTRTPERDGAGQGLAGDAPTSG
jgi:hypothetical protein